MAFVVAALVLSAIGAFEFARRWLLYTSLEETLGMQRAFTNYLMRGESLRALGSLGHPIALGYVMAVATGFFLYLRKSVRSTTAWSLGLVALVVGLLAPVSRGPWVGAAAMLLVFVATGPSTVRGFVKVALAGVIILPLMLLTPAGEAIIDHLPFIGTVDEGSVTYRQRLLEISIQVILQNPFFGAYNFIYSPAMQELKQGQGIIDIVNTYVAIGLGSGLVGLSIFLAFFGAVAVGIYKSMSNLADRNDELYLLGRVLLSTLLGILVIIATVSSVSVIPLIYWSVAGLGVAYARMLAPANAREAAMPASIQPMPIKTGTHFKKQYF
jgi:O-antigen ligase